MPLNYSLLLHDVCNGIFTFLIPSQLHLWTIISSLSLFLIQFVNFENNHFAACLVYNFNMLEQ